MIRKIFNKHIMLMIMLMMFAFIFGVKGYRMAGAGWFDSFYSAFALFYVNPVSEDVDNIFVMICKFVAPLSVAGVFIGTIKEIYSLAKNYRVARGSDDAIVIYSDSHFGKIFASNISHAIMATGVGAKFYSNVKSHVIMFRDEQKNLEFYNEHYEILKDKQVYLLINDIATGSIMTKSYKAFNLNEMVARQYWTEEETGLIKYFRNDRKKISIGIEGRDKLAAEIFRCALLYNTYDLQQEITYYFWGDKSDFTFLTEGFDTAITMDNFVYCGRKLLENESDIEIVKSLDRMILCDENDVKNIQILVTLCNGTDIHYFDPECIQISKAMDTENHELKSFGDYNLLLTQNNVMREALYSQAKKLSYIYDNPDIINSIDQEPWELVEDSWNKCSAYAKKSNIAAADYNQIRNQYIEEISGTENEKIEVLAELEHIRWCRFLYSEHWHKAESSDPRLGGTTKCASQKLHSCLIPYNQLSEPLKQLDRNNVISFI